MYKFRKGEYARVVRDESLLDPRQLPYAGQIVKVDEDDYVPYCICSDGKIHVFDEDELEKLMKRGDIVLCWDDDESCAVEHIFAGEIPGEEYPYKAVRKGHEDDFRAYESGKHAVTFGTTPFKHCKPLPDKIKVTVEIGGKEQTAYISRESAKALELI